MKFLDNYHNFLKSSKYGKIVYQVESLLVALIVALIIRQFVVATFKIPSSSMENTLMIGDFLIGTKFNWGAKIPFVNRKMPSFSSIKPGNIVIFKSPYPPYLDFIKRCIAVSGDTIQYINKKLYINGIQKDMHTYGKRVSSEKIQYRDNFPSLVVPSIGDTLKIIDGDIRNNTYFVNLLKQENPDKNFFVDYSFVVDGKEMKYLDLSVKKIYPEDLGVNLGIFEVPTMQMDQLRKMLPDVDIKIKYKVSMNGKKINKFVVKTKCYFMMGDNRDNSEDSRFWGFVSDRSVLAKPLIVLFSFSPNGYKRIGTLID